MDWRVKLAKEDQELLDTLLLKIEKYKNVYEKAENPQLVQMWLILLELVKNPNVDKNSDLKLVKKILMPKHTEIMDTIENY